MTKYFLANLILLLLFCPFWAGKATGADLRLSLTIGAKENGLWDLGVGEKALSPAKLVATDNQLSLNASTDRQTFILNSREKSYTLDSDQTAQLATISGGETIDLSSWSVRPTHQTDSGALILTVE